MRMMKAIEIELDSAVKVICILPIIINLVSSHPIIKSEFKEDLDKNEEHFPNGTVIGKYAYTDNEGNPIHVKYFADDHGYGIELSSFKVIQSTGDPTQTRKSMKLDNTQQNSEYILNSLSDFSNPLKPKYESEDDKGLLTRDARMNRSNNADGSNPEYEIFTKNELSSPTQCGSDKVKVYIGKDKRNTRDTSESRNNAEEYCNNF